MENIDERRFGRKVAHLRKESGLSQEELAKRLHVSPQAVSKWENGHSLPETALLPALSKLLDTRMDDLFSINELIIIEALFGDGLESFNVTKRLNRLIENGSLSIIADSRLLGVVDSGSKPSFLTVKYQSTKGICYAAFSEFEALYLTENDEPYQLPEKELRIIAGRYGTKTRNYNIMPKIEHYKAFNPSAYNANHETFPSDPANDETEYLTLVYLSKSGIRMATCAEGESLVYDDEKIELLRREMGSKCFIKDVPMLPAFGEGMECSWAAALTSALLAMNVKTDYTEVMGFSGACYRIAFCSPKWDYSSVDGLVAYDYAAPGYAAYGYMPEMHCNIEKADRPAHRERIMKEIRNGMPVLGINLRVAPEWGVICGYDKNGEELYCRTKYDKPTIENDPVFMKGWPPFSRDTINNEYDYLAVDNWPFLLCYFGGRQQPMSPEECLRKSLHIFTDCALKEKDGGYYMGFKAYEVWAADLRDELWYENCGDEQLARRFSVNQFCGLALLDARKAAYSYLSGSQNLVKDNDQGEIFKKIVFCFENVFNASRKIHNMLDSGVELDAERVSQFWTAEKRQAQADLLDEIASVEREAYELALSF